MPGPTMNENEAVEMMQRCSAEIKDLRQQIASLRPKADAYDNLATVLSLLPRPSVGYSEDVSWMLDKRIAEIKAARAKGAEVEIDG